MATKESKLAKDLYDALNRLKALSYSDRKIMK